MSDEKFLFPDPLFPDPRVLPAERRNIKVLVLDHGYVQFISSMGSDESIIEAARMSTQRGFVSWEPYNRCEKCELVQLTGSGLVHPACIHGEHQWKFFPRGDLGLLETGWVEGHTSPIEMCELLVQVKLPIFVVREWHRHRTQSYNEMSARYTQMPNEHFVPELQRFEPKKTGNKQADSLDGVTVRIGTADAQRGIVEQQEDIYDLYETMLRGGVPKEVARVNTPVSRYTVMRAKANLWNWFRFLSLRDHKAAQWEMQQYATAIGEIVKAIWPRSYAFWEEHSKYAVRLSRTEHQLLKEMLTLGRSSWTDEEQKLLRKLIK